MMLGSSNFPDEAGYGTVGSPPWRCRACWKAAGAVSSSICPLLWLVAGAGGGRVGRARLREGRGQSLAMHPWTSRGILSCFRSFPAQHKSTTGTAPVW